MKKINFNNKVLDKISNSKQIGDNEKLNFLKYVSYLSKSEQLELVKLL